MQSIINNIGEKNIYILIGIIAVIIVALIIVVIIEKRSEKKFDIENNYIKKEKKRIKNKKVTDDLEIKKEDNIAKEEVKEQKKVIYEEKKKKDEDITYVTHEQTPEEAKKAIEEAAKKLVYEEKSDIISPTFFEKVQEEQSIISYDELMNTNVYEVINQEKELMDEGNEPITLEEVFNDDKKDDELLESLKEEKQVFETNEQKEEKQINEDYDKKFKPSEVISPVFGVKREVVYQKEYNELGETINIKELDVEIKKTEEFLKELKKLKNKLD